MSAQFECQEPGCEQTEETPAEAIQHAESTGHTLLAETDNMTMRISLEDEDEDGDDEE